MGGKERKQKSTMFPQEARQGILCNHESLISSPETNLKICEKKNQGKSFRNRAVYDILLIN